MFGKLRPRVLVQEPNILISLGTPKGLIAAANIFVFLHVIAGYQVFLTVHLPPSPAGFLVCSGREE